MTLLIRCDPPHLRTKGGLLQFSRVEEFCELNNESIALYQIKKTGTIHIGREKWRNTEMALQPELCTTLEFCRAVWK